MRGEGFRARVVEVFPLRLAGEVLVDLTLEVGGEGELDRPRPHDLLRVRTEDGPVEIPIWAAPRVSQPEGSRRLNVQVRRRDAGEVRLEDGMEVEVRPPGAGPGGLA